MFGSLSLTPVTATSPEAAARILRMLVVALVVVDGKSGTLQSRTILEDVPRLRYHPRVVVVDRRPDPDIRRQVLAMGAEDYLVHPVLAEDIVHVLLPNHARAQGATYRTR